MKREFWKKDWPVALVIGAAFALASVRDARLLEGTERAAYDFGVGIAAESAKAPEKIAVIAIDDASIAAIGRWPWPRSILADFVTQLATAQPKLIGIQIFLAESQTDPGLSHIRKIANYVNESKLARLAPSETEQISEWLQQAETDLNADQKLASALPVAGNVFMPMLFKIEPPLGKPDAALPEFVSRNRLTKIAVPADAQAPYATSSAWFPLPLFAQATAGIGHLNLIQDVDGAVRTEPLVLEHFGDYYPSLALLLAAQSLNLGPADISVEVVQGGRMGVFHILTYGQYQMYTGFYPSEGPSAPYLSYSFQDVRSGKVPLALFKNKLVIIGPTAAGVGNSYVTPVSHAQQGPELTANTVASILNQNFFTRPAWTQTAEIALFLAVLAYLMFALPRLSAGLGAGVSLAILLALIVAAQWLLVGEHVWLKTGTPALFLFAGHLLLTTKRFFITEQAKTAVEKDSAHTNRMLGLAFQNQGQLDMALDKFRTLPVDDSVLELIYNVALDFERKRQFNKAASAYDYILKHNPKFKDVGDKRKRAQQADSTLVLGGKQSSPGGTLVLDVEQKPTLGRYQVEKELGRGAMGAVYLGRDPKINRVVAIKTMALSQEFNANELVEVKARFFREAETAGRLNHPNIVTIYDAGEEHDLAYIAMEYLHGQNLADYTEAQNLFPPKTALQMVAKLADALHYAHKQDVVHRDIKPANIMYDPKDHSLKITDFGIARITASSRTKTGVIMGTPSYMSPEQLAGKHVDGRSDLFSLGVMLYEMLTGRQPFIGDSMATLMFQIANEKHPDIVQARADLPPSLRPVIDKALAKDPAKRFQTGEELAAALMQCLQTWN